MKVVRAIPTQNKNYGVVVEVFDPLFCERARWTKKDNVKSDTGIIIVLNDDDNTGVGWLVKNGELSNPHNPKLWHAIEIKKAEIAECRYNVEVSGVDFGGCRMHTDRESQAKYIGAIVVFQATGTFPQAWKGIDGWVPITSKDVLFALSGVVSKHVNDCYAKEAELEFMIDSATTIDEVNAINWE